MTPATQLIQKVLLSQFRPDLLRLVRPADPLKVILQMLVGAQVAGARMALKVLGAGGAATEAAQLAARLGRRDFLVGDGAQVLADPQPTRVP